MPVAINPERAAHGALPLLHHRLGHDLVQVISDHNLNGAPSVDARRRSSTGRVTLPWPPSTMWRWRQGLCQPGS
jgi:hypothetical protein